MSVRPRRLLHLALLLVLLPLSTVHPAAAHAAGGVRRAVVDLGRRAFPERVHRDRGAGTLVVTTWQSPRAKESSALPYSRRAHAREIGWAVASSPVAGPLVLGFAAGLVGYFFGAGIHAPYSDAASASLGPLFAKAFAGAGAVTHVLARWASR